MKRGMTKEETAEYCGCRTLAAFDNWRRKGIVPGPIPGTNVYDRKAVDRALDRVSGITDAPAELSAYKRARAEHEVQTETA